METNLMEDVSLTVLCTSCEASFKIIHSMNDNAYSIRYCPFCGEELELEEGDTFYFQDDEEDF
jgi:Zn finger protein HypA/HybF involved in hydrogenase expression